MTIRFIILLVDSSVIICLLVQYGFNLPHKKDGNNGSGESKRKTKVV